jgi:hypothetical protein
VQERYEDRFQKLLVSVNNAAGSSRKKLANGGVSRTRYKLLDLMNL